MRARSGVEKIGSPGPTGRVPLDTPTRLFNRVRSDLTAVKYDTFRVQREHDDDPHRVVRCPAKLEGKAKNSRSTGSLIYDAGTQPQRREAAVRVTGNDMRLRRCASPAQLDNEDMWLILPLL